MWRRVQWVVVDINLVVTYYRFIIDKILHRCLIGKV